MNKRLGPILILTSLFLTGCLTHPPKGKGNTNTKPGEITLKYKILDVPLFAQTTKMWCWAASMEMIMHYYGEKLPQHVQANNKFERRDCGPKTRSSGCIKTAWPENRLAGCKILLHTAVIAAEQEKGLISISLVALGRPTLQIEEPLLGLAPNQESMADVDHELHAVSVVF